MVRANHPRGLLPEVHRGSYRRGSRADHRHGPHAFLDWHPQHPKLRSEIPGLLAKGLRAQGCGEWVADRVLRAAVFPSFAVAAGPEAEHTLVYRLRSRLREARLVRPAAVAKATPQSRPCQRWHRALALLRRLRCYRLRLGRFRQHRETFHQLGYLRSFQDTGPSEGHW